MPSSGPHYCRYDILAYRILGTHRMFVSSEPEFSMFCGQQRLGYEARDHVDLVYIHRG